MRIALLVCLLVAPLYGQDKKASFDASSLERTSLYMGQWRKAIKEERLKAEKTGNDIALMELLVDYQEELNGLIGKEIKWQLKFKAAVNGQVLLAEDYRFKTHGIRVQLTSGIGRSFMMLGADDIQEIEPWMKNLKPGQTVNATGVVSGFWSDAIVLAKVKIKP